MKTTGVKDIPKFGLLVFLGHPTVNIIVKLARLQKNQKFYESESFAEMSGLHQVNQ